MKGLLLACLSLASLAAGLPTLRRQNAVTTQELNNFELFVQWAEAAGCNSAKNAGDRVTCNPGQCTLFESHNATIVQGFIGTVLDTEGFVGVDPVAKQIVVTFRGTTSIQNWIADLTFVQVPCDDLTPGCLVHAGFLASWAEVASAVRAGVSAATAAHPTYQLVLTGHSLGGAVATLAAAYLRKAGYAAQLYTYGSPRVGNLALAQFVTSQPGGEYRVTHTDDPVPRLPPIFVNFRHTSPEYWIDSVSSGDVVPTDIETCGGYANVQCNGGQGGLDGNAHLWYFQALNGCSSSQSSSKRDDETVSDADIEAKLNLWLEMDKQAAQNLQAEGQS